MQQIVRQTSHTPRLLLQTGTEGAHAVAAAAAVAAAVAATAVAATAAVGTTAVAAITVAISAKAAAVARKKIVSDFNLNTFEEPWTPD